MNKQNIEGMLAKEKKQKIRKKELKRAIPTLIAGGALLVYYAINEPEEVSNFTSTLNDLGFEPLFTESFKESLIQKFRI